ncbi:MAG: hypothetical protein IPH02_16680 [Sphingobacteriales bacterium]|nr:hypothetical protein [Sphingobacteriales bacterium]
MSEGLAADGASFSGSAVVSGLGVWGRFHLCRPRCHHCHRRGATFAGGNPSGASLAVFVFDGLAAVVAAVVLAVCCFELLLQLITIIKTSVKQYV